MAISRRTRTIFHRSAWWSCAGSAMPRQFIEWYEKKYGIHFRLAWGMTETTPIATFMALKDRLARLAGSSSASIFSRATGSPSPASTSASWMQKASSCPGTA